MEAHKERQGGSRPTHLMRVNSRPFFDEHDLKVHKRPTGSIGRVFDAQTAFSVNVLAEDGIFKILRKPLLNLYII